MERPEEEDIAKLKKEEAREPRPEAAVAECVRAVKPGVRFTGRLASEVEDALWELVAAGLVTADGFENLQRNKNADTLYWASAFFIDRCLKTALFLVVDRRASRRLAVYDKE